VVERRGEEVGVREGGMVVIGGEIRMARKVEHQANSLLNSEVDLAVVVAVTLHRPRRIMGFVSILVSSDGYF
jgi:hypothetical protein